METLIQQAHVISTRTANGVRKTESAITIDSIKDHAYKTEFSQAQLRQVVDFYYPKRKANSDGLFSNEDFGVTEEHYQSNKVCWIDIPKGMDEKQLQEKLNNFPNARIKRVLSSTPIFTEDELSWSRTLSEVEGEDFLVGIMDKQIVRNNKGEEVPGSNGQRQFARNFFSKDGEPDQNLIGNFKVISDIAE